MKFSRFAKIELCCADEPGRYDMTAPYLDVEHKQLVATDGRTIAMLDVELDPTDTAGHIDLAPIILARKMRPTLYAERDNVDFVANGEYRLHNGATLPRGRRDDEFPKVRTVLPTEPPVFTITLNARYLWNLAQALACSTDSDAVKFEFWAHDRPARLTTKHGVGLVMPITVDD